MNIQNSIKAAIAILMFGAAAHASANVVTLNANTLSSNGYLSTGSYNGTFDGAGYLPTNYTVNSLSFSFKFTDDANDPFTNVNGVTTSSSSLTSTNGSNRSATTTTTYLKPVTSTGERESVKLAFDALVLNGQTSAGITTVTPNTVSGVPAKGADVYVKGSGNTTVICTTFEIAHDNSCKKVSYYTVTNTTTTTTATDYTGTITFDGNLLPSLFVDNKLNFGLDVIGDLFLSSASLDIDFTETTKQNDVPEPGSLALFGIALAGVAGIRRKHRA